MPWKQDYTISDEIALRDDEVRWPEGNRCCFTLTVDLSVARGPEGIRAADLMHPDAYFAAHDGLDQLVALLVASTSRRHSPSQASSRSCGRNGCVTCWRRGTRSQAMA